MWINCAVILFSTFKKMSGEKIEQSKIPSSATEGGAFRVHNVCQFVISRGMCVVYPDMSTTQTKEKIDKRKSKNVKREMEKQQRKAQRSQNQRKRR